MHGERFPASEAHRLDDPARNEWLPVAEVLGALKIQAGQTAADVGAGTGYFTLPLARAVGPEGKVCAVDAQAEMLSLLGQKLGPAGVGNVALVRAEADRTGLPASSCDLFFMANVWHEIEDRIAVLTEAMRLLKPGGRIALLDWRPDVEPEHGPPLAHRVDTSRAMEDLRGAGFNAIVRGEVGRYSWLIQAEKRS